MIILPAIDLRKGRCVQLTQGLPDQERVYSSDPVEMARKWESEGAEYLHVVDLDGAFEGKPIHFEVVSQIAAAIDIPVEIGGGLRTDADIRNVLEGGARRAVVGTRLVSEPEVLKRLAEEYGDRVVAGIDARDGRVQIEGWVETSEMEAVELARMADGHGIKTLIYTDTAVDGMLSGPNIEATGKMCSAVSCGVVASGGIRSADDIRRLRELGHDNLVGAIVGTALYEGEVTLEALMAACE
jgi:phosphoribosylformimino-5-aminoimidazole carboxamide ribotide isomerase